MSQQNPLFRMVLFDDFKIPKFTSKFTNEVSFIIFQFSFINTKKRNKLLHSLTHCFLYNSYVNVKLYRVPTMLRGFRTTVVMLLCNGNVVGQNSSTFSHCLRRGAVTNIYISIFYKRTNCQIKILE